MSSSPSSTPADSAPGPACREAGALLMLLSDVSASDWGMRSSRMDSRRCFVAREGANPARNANPKNIIIIMNGIEVSLCSNCENYYTEEMVSTVHQYLWYSGIVVWYPRYHPKNRVSEVKHEKLYFDLSWGETNHDEKFVRKFLFTISSCQERSSLAGASHLAAGKKGRGGAVPV